MIRYSDFDHINNAVIGLICCMRGNPYAPLERIEDGTMTIADVIEQVRLRFGDRAAKSVRIVVH